MCERLSGGVGCCCFLLGSKEVGEKMCLDLAWEKKRSECKAGCMRKWFVPGSGKEVWCGFGFGCTIGINK